MAGIGFELKRLTQQDNLMGIVRAHSHAMVVSAGPWFFAVLALGGVYPIFFSNYVAVPELINFRIIVVYNFGFSLMFAAPIYMVITRYLADCIHRKDVTHTPTVMLMSMGLLYLILTPLSLYYYGYYVDLPISLRIGAIADLFLVSLVWVLGIYLTALKDYTAVTRSFFTGFALAIFFAQVLKGVFGEASTLTGFNIGMMWIAFALVGRILAEYPYKLVQKTKVKLYFRKYWELALGGFFYKGAIWVDKCVMWAFAPEAIELPSKMIYYPDYDCAMFLAYVTIVPSMAVFIYSVETNFFHFYQRFYYDILEHKPLATIRVNHRKIIETLISSARNFFVVQGTVTIVSILIAAKLLELAHFNHISIGIFRLGLLGSFFHVLAMFEMVILAYFDCRKTIMYIQLVFFVTCGIFTYITTQMGFHYYGYGYFLSAFLTFVISSIALFEHIKKLPYHAFITNNNSLRPVFQGEEDTPPPPTTTIKLS